MCCPVRPLWSMRRSSAGWAMPTNHAWLLLAGPTGRQVAHVLGAAGVGGHQVVQPPLAHAAGETAASVLCEGPPIGAQVDNPRP